MVYRAATSLRAKPVEDTLEIARAVAPSYGITRVSEATWLDRIGIPVYNSIRPEGETLCVHSGKGRTPADCEVGAYMEAIEYAAAERLKHRSKPIPVPTAELRSIYEAAGFNLADFGTGKITSASPGQIACYEMTDVLTGANVPLPAELVSIGRAGPLEVFDWSTNGLASGNVFAEAAIHALCELLERDTSAFNSVFDRSVLLQADDLPESVESMFAKIEAAGLGIFVRYTPSLGGIPHFSAWLLENWSDVPVAVAFGVGCHPLKSVALTRAVAEAAQSRVGLIHGGRDDIPARVANNPEGERAITVYSRLRSFFSRIEGSIPYSAVPEDSIEGESLSDTLERLCRLVEQDGCKHVFARSIEERDELAVVRVVVPGLEFLEPKWRAGPRLRAYARQHGREGFLESVL